MPIFIAADGTEIAYETGGPAGAPPIVFLHGITGAGSTWHDIAADLAADHKTYAIDQRGHGKSGRAPGTYDMAHWAGDLVGFLETVVGEPAVVVGHSLGGAVTAEACASRPDLFERILLEDPPMFLAGGGGEDFGESPFGVVFRLMLADFRDKLARDAPLEEYVAANAAMPALDGSSRTMADVLGPEGSVRDAQAKQDFDPDALEQALSGSIADHDPAGRLSVPTLVLRADVFAAFREQDVEPFLAANPDATVELVAGASHLIHDERPAEFTKRLREFLAA